MTTRLGRLWAAYQATRAQGEDPTEAALEALRTVTLSLRAAIGALNADLSALRTEVAALRAAAPVTTPEDAPATPPPTPVVYAVNALALDEGPMRRHLLKLAAWKLNEPGQTPDTVAAWLLAGEED